MAMRRRRAAMGRIVVACLLAVLPWAVMGQPLENKWRLQFSGNAESSGTLVLVVTPKDADARRVEVAISEGTRENRVARTVRNALRDAIGDDFTVEVDDGEDVLVKRRWGRPRFNVSVASNDVDGVRLNLDQE